MKRSVFPVVVILALSACAVTRSSPVTELERTWKFAVVMLPGAYLSKEGTRTAPGLFLYSGPDEWSREVQAKQMRQGVDKVPVVLHMHGCEGIGGGAA